MSANCCNGHEAEMSEDQAHASRIIGAFHEADDYRFAVEARLEVLKLSLALLNDILSPENFLQFVQDMSEIVLYGGAADEGAAHEPEEDEIPGEEPLDRPEWLA